MKNQVPRATQCLEIILYTIQKKARKQWRWWHAAAMLQFALFGLLPHADAAGQLTVTPTSISFGSVAVGKTATIQATVKNTGSATVTLTGDTVTGGGFKVNAVTLPKTMSAGYAFTLIITFTPASAATYSGKITLISNASNSSQAISLSGIGIKNTAGYVSATPTSAQFGNVSVGTRNTQTVQLKNTGSQALTISSITPRGTGISVSGLTLPLPIQAGSAVNLTVSFLPAAAGAVSGSVTIASNASNSALSLAVSGTGITATRILSANPTSVSFGNVAVNSTAERQIYVTNSGNSSLYISGHTVSGAGLTVTGSNGVTLAPGQGMTLRADFVPKSAGSVAGSLTVTSNATNTTSLKVPLTGNGVASSTTHKVSLQWKASTSSGVSGYYVYRATASAGPFTQVSSLISGTSFTDSSVSSGATYYYRVTATNSTGTQSTYSNSVTAAIP